MRMLGAILRALGLACLGVAVLALALGLAAALFDWPMAIGPAGQAWYDLDPGSLNLAQAITERYLSVEIWDSLAFPLLEQPLLASLAILAVAFGLLGWLLRRLGRN